MRRTAVLLAAALAAFVMPAYGQPGIGNPGGRSIIAKVYLNYRPHCFTSPYSDQSFGKGSFSLSGLGNAGPGTGVVDSALIEPQDRGVWHLNAYGLPMTRVGGVQGAAFAATGFGSQGTVPWNNTISGTYGWDSRHHYTKDSPWNADGSLYYMENPTNTSDSTGNSRANTGVTGPTRLILRTSDWAVTSYMQCISGGDSIRDLRWHPTNPNWMIVLKQTTSGASNDTAYNFGDYVGILDVTTCKIVRRTPILNEGTPDAAHRIIKANLIGAGEGSITADGSKIMLLTLHRQQNFTRPDSLQVVDLNTMALGAAFPVPPCSLEVDASPGGGSDNQKMDCNIGHASLAPSGNLAWILYASDDAQDGASTIDTTDAIRVFDVSGTTITGFHALNRDTVWRGPTNDGVRAQCATSMIGGANTVTGSCSWVSNLKHADSFQDPFTGHDCLVGVAKCGSSSNQGKMQLIDLQTGRMKRLEDNTVISGQSNEATPVHASARWQISNPGWAVFSYDDINLTQKPIAEIVLIKTDGSGKMVRIADDRSADTYYRGEGHPVLSWDGRFCAFNTNWYYRSGTNRFAAATTPPSHPLVGGFDMVVDLGSLCLP